jgi:hypothetical protein
MPAWDEDSTVVREPRSEPSDDQLTIPFETGDG